MSSGAADRAVLTRCSTKRRQCHPSVCRPLHLPKPAHSLLQLMRLKCSQAASVHGIAGLCLSCCVRTLLAGTTCAAACWGLQVLHTMPARMQQMQSAMRQLHAATYCQGQRSSRIDVGPNDQARLPM